MPLYEITLIITADDLTEADDIGCAISAQSDGYFYSVYPAGEAEIADAERFFTPEMLMRLENDKESL